MILANYDSLITINGTGISGASISTFAYQNPNVLIQNLGGRGYTSDPRGCQFPNQFSPITFSITKPLCISGGEPLKQLTGNVGISGTIQTDTTGISFTSGYLTRYGVIYGMDEGPNLTMDFAIFGAVGSDRVTSPVYFSNQGHFANRALIDLDISGAAGLIDDFKYTIDVERAPVFVLGSKYPAEVVSPAPLKFSFSAKGYVDDTVAFPVNNFNVTGINDAVGMTLYVSGGISGNILLDSQSGTFYVDSKDVSISIDDEMTFSIEASTYI